jgi:diketogulonate reductase-like aldo/keto reductase
MKYETLPDGSSIPVLGLGTWPMGGGGQPDYSQDDETVAILHELIEMGYTHLDTAESYGRNHCEELVGRAIQDFPRESLFITTKVAPEHLRYQDVLSALHGSLKRLQTEYVDLYLIHWPSKDIPLRDTFRALNELIGSGVVRRVGVSNFDVPLLEEAVALSDAPIATNQVHYNLLHRKPVENGVLNYCQSHNILLTAYSPIKDGVLDNPVVKEVAQAHDATPAQIAIAWLLAQPRVITIPKTSRPERGRENLEALEIELSPQDLAALNGITGP